MPKNLALKLLASFAILISVSLVVNVWGIGHNSQVGCIFLGSLLIFGGSRPSPKQIGLSVAFGTFIAVLYQIFDGYCVNVIAIGAFWGVGGILTMWLTKIWSTGATATLVDALIMPGFTVMGGITMANAPSHQLSYDFFLYKFDANLGLTPGSAMASLFHTLPWIKAVSRFAYDNLILFPCLFHAWAVLRGKAAKFHLLYVFVISGTIGSFFYRWIPAMGPLYAFGSQFPNHLPAGSAVAVHTFMATGIFNALPSLHMTWALLIWVAAWELGSVATLSASIFVLFTGFATIGFGEHYFIDLVVAVPLMLLIRGIVTLQPLKICVGGGLVMGWVLYLHTGIQVTRVLNWSFVVVTILMTGLLMAPAEVLSRVLQYHGGKRKMGIIHKLPAGSPLA